MLRPTFKSTLTGGKILSARGSHGTLWRRLFFRYPIGTSGFLTGPTAESRGPVTGSRLLHRLLIGKVQPPMAEHKYSTGPRASSVYGVLDGATSVLFSPGRRRAGGCTEYPRIQRQATRDFLSLRSSTSRLAWKTFRVARQLDFAVVKALRIRKCPLPDFSLRVFFFSRSLDMWGVSACETSPGYRIHVRAPWQQFP